MDLTVYSQLPRSSTPSVRSGSQSNFGSMAGSQVGSRASGSRASGSRASGSRASGSRASNCTCSCRCSQTSSMSRSRSSPSVASGFARPSSSLQKLTVEAETTPQNARDVRYKLGLGCHQPTEWSHTSRKIVVVPTKHDAVAGPHARTLRPWDAATNMGGYGGHRPMFWQPPPEKEYP